MRKSFLFIILFFCAGQLIAQKLTTPAPFNNTFSGKLLQPLKADSALRVNPPIMTGKLFKQEDLDLSKIKLDSKQQPLLIVTADGYKMPILNLNNTSKMPVVVLDGYSKMPIAGKDISKAKRATPATPVP